MGGGVSIAVVAACGAALSVFGASARAQTAAPATVGGVTVTPPSCRTSQDPGPLCAAARLDQAAKAAQTKAAGAPLPTIPASAGTPAAALGIPTPMALGQQFGPNLGRSVTPWRPPAPPVAPSNLGRTPR
jgi:hypothetical protein